MSSILRLSFLALFSLFIFSCDKEDITTDLEEIENIKSKECVNPIKDFELIQNPNETLGDHLLARIYKDDYLERDENGVFVSVKDFKVQWLVNGKNYFSSDNSYSYTFSFLKSRLEKQGPIEVCALVFKEGCEEPFKLCKVYEGDNEENKECVNPIKDFELIQNPNETLGDHLLARIYKDDYLERDENGVFVSVKDFKVQWLVNGKNYFSSDNSYSYTFSFLKSRLEKQGPIEVCALVFKEGCEEPFKLCKVYEGDNEENKECANPIKDFELIQNPNETLGDHLLARIYKDDYLERDESGVFVSVKDFKVQWLVNGKNYFSSDNSYSYTFSFLKSRLEKQGPIEVCALVFKEGCEEPFKLCKVYEGDNEENKECVNPIKDFELIQNPNETLGDHLLARIYKDDYLERDENGVFVSVKDFKVQWLVNGKNYFSSDNSYSYTFSFLKSRLEKQGPIEVCALVFKEGCEEPFKLCKVYKGM